MTQQVNTSDWQKVERTFEKGEQFNFNVPGDEIIGALTDVRHGTTKHGDTVFCDVRNDAGLFTFIASTALKMLLTPAMIGYMVKITFVGEQYNPKTQQKFKAFEVFQGPKVDDATLYGLSDTLDNPNDEIPF
jgi:hypothetical protein